MYTKLKVECHFTILAKCRFTILAKQDGETKSAKFYLLCMEKYKPIHKPDQLIITMREKFIKHPFSYKIEALKTQKLSY